MLVLLVLVNLLQARHSELPGVLQLEPRPETQVLHPKQEQVRSSSTLYTTTFLLDTQTLMNYRFNAWIIFVCDLQVQHYPKVADSAVEPAVSKQRQSKLHKDHCLRVNCIFLFFLFVIAKIFVLYS